MIWDTVLGFCLLFCWSLFQTSKHYVLFIYYVFLIKRFKKKEALIISLWS